MGELTNRVHVLLDDDRMQWLRGRAASAGTSVGGVIRSAIDRDREAAHAEQAARRAAVGSLLAAPPLPVGTPEELDREIEEMYDRGQE